MPSASVRNEGALQMRPAPCGYSSARFLLPHSFLSLSKKERKESPRRQKKPAPFRFRRGGENSISAGSFFLSESRPLCWVAFRLILEKKENIQNQKCVPCRHHVTAQLPSLDCPPKSPYVVPLRAARHLDDGGQVTFTDTSCRGWQRCIALTASPSGHRPDVPPRRGRPGA